MQRAYRVLNVPRYGGRNSQAVRKNRWMDFVTSSEKQNGEFIVWLFIASAAIKCDYSDDIFTNDAVTISVKGMTRISKVLASYRYINGFLPIL